MGEYLDQIPEPIRAHIRQITSTSGLPAGEESVEMIAQAWLEKKRIFEEQLAGNKLEEVETFAADEAGGALILTYSGSLLTVGPLVDDVRRVEYSSIGLRTDVPQSAANDASVLSADAEVDQVAEFEAGPIRRSSAVFKIAVAREELEPEAEAQLLSDVTQVLTEEFVEVNKTVIRE